MKKFIFIFTLMISYIISFGQNQTVNAAYNLSIAAENKNSPDRANYIQGTPYKSDEFIKATFYQKERAAIELPTRLNFFRSNFELLVENKTYMADPLSIDSIKTKDQLYLFKAFDFNGKKSSRIVELIGKSGKGALYKYTGVEFKPEVKAGGYIDPKPAAYVWDEPIFLIEVGDKIFELSNWNKLTNNFAGKEKEIKNFIKSNKIKKDNPTDLIKLLQFVDKLI